MTTEKDLQKYIHSAHKAGYTPSQIRNILLRNGFTKQDISRHLKEESSKEKSNEKNVDKLKQKFSAFFQMLSPRKWGNVSLAIYFLALVVLLAILFILLMLSRNDEFPLSPTDIFLEKANNCKESQTTFDVQGSTLLITAKDCILTKEFIDFSIEEPEELVAFLQNKSMACPYNEHTLMISHLSLTYGLNECTGSLKDALYDIRIFQTMMEEEGI